MNNIPLTSENYFSLEASRAYMSNSQFKAFSKCPAAVMAELSGEYEPCCKDCFTEGHLFEAVVCGDEKLFFMQHPEIISSQGKTKGQPKSNYLAVIAAAEAVKRQAALMEIINRSRKQVILTGMINNVPYKGCLDLYDPETGDCWDTKCMRNFESTYSTAEGRRLEWWENYGYQYQAAIYRELCRQNGMKTGRFGLIAATKESVPDVTWLQFDGALLDHAYDVVYELSSDYQAIKAGLIDAEPCGVCDYCKAHKIISQPEIITQCEEDED